MPTPKHHNTRIEKTAYYSTLGTLNQKVKYLWIICHGYGQLASQIIHKFSSIQSEEHFFIAPEGLSRFYWNESKGIIGASWMTKQDRLREIDDYCNYIQSLVDQHVTLCGPDTKLIGFGFSQGGATVWRWMMKKQPKLHSLLMWASMTPEDLDYRAVKAYLKDIKLYSVHGTDDKYLTQARMDFQANLEKEQELDIKHYTFDGKHVVDRETLVNVVNEILR